MQIGGCQLLLIGNGASAHERDLRAALADWPEISTGDGLHIGSITGGIARGSSIHGCVG